MAIDVETTGLSVERDRIKSISAVVGNRAFGMLHKISLITDADDHVSSPDALAIHRIPDALPGALSLRMALRLLEHLRRGAPVLMHHKAFDGPMLRAAHDRAGLPLPDYLSDLGLVYDTMQIGKDHYPGQPTGLTSLAKAANLAPSLVRGRSERHDSLDDAILSFELWRAHEGPTRLDLDQPGDEGSPDAAPKRPEFTDAAAGMDWMG